MGKGKNQHVVKHLNDWAVKGAGNSKATKVTRPQSQAIEKAESIAKNQFSSFMKAICFNMNRLISLQDKCVSTPK